MLYKHSKHPMFFFLVMCTVLMEYSLYNFCKHGNVSFELNILKQVL